MHYFHNLSSASEGFAPRPLPGLHPWVPTGGLFSFWPLTCPPLEKILRAPMLPLYCALGRTLYETHALYQSNNCQLSSECMLIIVIKTVAWMCVVAWRKVVAWFCINSTRENCCVRTTSWSLITSRTGTIHRSLTLLHWDVSKVSEIFDRTIITFNLHYVQWHSKALRGPGSTVTWGPSVASARGLNLEARNAESGVGALRRACCRSWGAM